ncbi:hypothetical protein MICAE_450019 [Microcystis aeruginosa PCC 9806]|uniref:Uncharacterized protein n=1 Tax=Microcystis aeruginosa PCC 9806 TaxID=1160282 RepID=I4GYU4_MICAE|nr:hypothetical protein MICAE_450019 [Microcystis aeruginosa PCC 9806]
MSYHHYNKITTSQDLMGEKYVNIPDSSEFQKLSGGNLVSSTHHLFNRC